MTVSLGANGSLQAAVFPNTGSTPQGTYYKVLLDLDDGTRSTEYWVVPQVPQTTIAAVRSLIVPQTQAMQFVGRDYVDTAIANVVASSVELTGASDDSRGEDLPELASGADADESRRCGEPAVCAEYG